MPAKMNRTFDNTNGCADFNPILVAAAAEAQNPKTPY